MKIARPNKIRIAVVGAGMAGLACAAALRSADADVTLFDKSRRIGGRLATRRVNGLMFDHGAQYATSRDPAFAAVMSAMAASGDAAVWPASGDGRWCGVPGMSALARHMERRGVGMVHTGRHAAFLHRRPDGWMAGWCAIWMRLLHRRASYQNAAVSSLDRSTGWRSRSRRPRQQNCCVRTALQTRPRAPA